MNSMKKIAFILLMLCVQTGFAQKKKIWVSGAARAIMYGDDYNTEAQNDSITPRKTQGGHALVDLGINIQPSDQILIQGMVRIRNDYGGFWGSGVTFDVRQLYIKGILGGFLKYQLGDINYKLTNYTFNNEVSMVNKYKGAITAPNIEQVQYDLFYTDDNVWRQQGGAIDFALEFDKGVKEMEFNLFTMRVRPTDFATQEDQLYSGGSVVIEQSKFLKFGGQFANMYDLKGTSDSEIYLSNPVYTGSAEVNYKWNKTHVMAAGEFGTSKLGWEGSPDAPQLQDYFYDVSVKAAWAKTGVDVTVGYRDVGPNFRSAGAQTMRINYQSAPAAYQRYGNTQDLRAISMADLYRDASLYQTQISAGLMAYDPRYDNATPYGRATPNRKGVNVVANYKDPEARWTVSADADILSGVVGEGTTTNKNYTTLGVFGELKINKMLNWKDRKLWVSGRIGTQQTSRSGGLEFENVDLASKFNNINLTATIYGDLDFIAEYRTWATKGNDQLAERNEYSEIIDYSEYVIDYKESIIGAGLQYGFSEKNNLRFIWQTFTWQDELKVTLPYDMNTWTLLFTMKF
ncbi:MAG: hypothetical protein ACI9GM_001028 [Salibacteraceae bacterium]|jgi:hypothetical protein